MLHCRAKFFLVVVIILWGVRGAAQKGENNPYSKYGIGEMSNGNNAVLRGMGNITSAYKNAYILNSDNPASYSYLERTTFEVGGTASTRTINGSGFNYRTGTATLSHLSLGFPVHKNAGISIGFKPYTQAYYFMADTIAYTTTPPSPIDSVMRIYQGSGGLNYAYFGAGAKYKGFSFGFNLGYMFGTIRRRTTAFPIDTQKINKAYTADFNDYLRFGGLHWKCGVMYETTLDSGYSLRLGGTFTLNQNLFERLNAYQVSSYDLRDTMINDTTYNSGERQGKLTLPMSFSIGAMLTHGTKWNVGIDFTTAQWSGFKSQPDTILRSGVGSSSYKLALGGEFTPDANSIRNYMARVTYRLGLYYGTDYLRLYNTVLPCYGVTAGASLPFRRSQSQIHMAVDIGRLGLTEKSLMEQTYIRFTLGVSINDKWFMKRKYD